jgi:hypothetical protein
VPKKIVNADKNIRTHKGNAKHKRKKGTSIEKKEKSNTLYRLLCEDTLKN